MNPFSTRNCLWSPVSVLFVEPPENHKKFPMANCSMLRAQALFLSQNASCVVLSPAVCRAPIWSEDERTKFCSIHSTSQCAETQHGKCVQDDGNRTMKQHSLTDDGGLSEDLSAFLLAVQKATRGFLYICVPVTWPTRSAGADRGAAVRKCTRTADRLSPDAGGLSCKPGSVPATASPAWLCCCVFRLVHRLYALLSSSHPEAFVLPVHAQGEWQQNFHKAVCAHIRAFPALNETPAVPGHAAATTLPEQQSSPPSFPRDALDSVSRSSDAAANQPKTSPRNRSVLVHDVQSQDTTATGRTPPSQVPSDVLGFRLCPVCEHVCPSKPASRDVADAFAENIRVSIPPSQFAAAFAAARLPAEQSPSLSGDSASESTPEESLLPLCRVVTETELLNHVLVAGAFDRLHAGHKILLMAAALLARQRVGLAVTAGGLISRKVTDAYLAMASGIEPFCLRSRSAAAFLALVLQATGHTCVFRNYTELVLSEELGFSEKALSGADSCMPHREMEGVWRDALAKAPRGWNAQPPVSYQDQTEFCCEGGAAESRPASLWRDAVDFPALNGRFCRQNKQGKRTRESEENQVSVHLYRIDDPLGPSGDLDFDALVVSAESIAGGRFVNAERVKRKNRPVLLIEIPTLPPATPRSVWRLESRAPKTADAIARDSSSPLQSHEPVRSSGERQELLAKAHEPSSSECVPNTTLSRQRAPMKLSSTALRCVQATRLGVSREDLEYLFNVFHTAASTLIGAPAPVRNVHWTTLCEMNSAPWRRFFTFQRLVRLVRLVERQCGETPTKEPRGGKLTRQQRDAVSLSLFFAYAGVLPAAALCGQRATFSLETQGKMDEPGLYRSGVTSERPTETPENLQFGAQPSNETSFARALLSGCFVDAASAKAALRATSRLSAECGSTEHLALVSSEDPSTREWQRDSFAVVWTCVEAVRSVCPFLLYAEAHPKARFTQPEKELEAETVQCLNAVQLVEMLDIAIPWSEYLSDRVQPFVEENSFLSVHEYRRLRANQIRVWLSQFSPETHAFRLESVGLTQNEIQQLVSNLKTEMKLLSVPGPDRDASGVPAARQTGKRAAS
ncbi:hypothetical protein TGME49_230990 [Toxoplasma gondii ME49]|uniref:Cytidyltransferase-like domain-containing protein n=2 Tax=Toxoplasma gondii TaxID=5811 RepID=S8F2W5_TOXGM|nr:hypothetical protein TGME49_230990 [Toxoplasma gondii ME49]EPT28977.1 hypothetical protein TGME49_230990 [Toxoplasma gondii ME49]KYF46071.1 hypothetical protein TGARI_230990 [Toxoplasma gondii ARI]|eukprot:XP_018636863.1 hypothetical protein TGME49_230990 [Toxoplasma gondii ME49]